MKNNKNTICSRFSILLFLFVVFPPVIALADTEPGTIISFGDSLTEGCLVYAGNCGWERNGDGGYQIELETLLQSSLRNYQVRNFGHGGETAYDGMSRIDSVMDEICNYGAEYILILEGTNDLFHGARGSDVKYYLNVMINKSRNKGLVPLLATIPPDPDHSYKNIPLMNEYIRDLASEQNVTLVELYNGMEPSWNSYVPGCYKDNLHPNSDGFKVMGEIWFGALADLIQPQPPLTWLQLLLK